MIKVPIDEAGWTKAGIAWIKDGQFYRFMIPGRPGSANAKFDAKNLLLVPKASTTHTALCAYLKIPIPEE